ncbi:MAG: glycosyltransferase family 39 protein [Syntrophorhabdaceae bacterium]
MKPDRQKIITYTIVLIILSYIFLFMGLGCYSLKEPDEGRYAQIPREMVQSGDYTVPRLNDVRYFEKPPLLYWAMAASYKVFGVSEWSFRFPNALAAALCVFSLFFFLRRWADDLAAFLGSLVLLSSFGFFAMARIVTTDMILAFWLFLALLCFYEYYRSQKTLFIYGFYSCAAFATLTKGPVAPVLLGFAILVFLITESNVGFIRRMKLVRGVLLYLAIAAPWFIVISIREKEFFNFFFVDQHILRFLSKKHKRSGPIYYFIPVLLGGMIPWSLFIPRACVAIWRRPECRFFLIWSAIVFAFFSVSGSKLPPYILPIFPTLSALIGILFYEKRESAFNRPWDIAGLGIFFAIIALSCLLYLSPSFIESVSQVAMDTRAIVSDLKYLSIQVSITAALCLVLLFFRQFRKPVRLFAILLIFSASTIIAIVAHSAVIDRINTTKELALCITREKPQPDIIINYSGLDLTLPFYLGRPVIIASYTGELAMGAKYDDAANIFMDEADFFHVLASDRKILFVTKVKRVRSLEKRFPGRLRILACQNDRCLLSNY